MKRLRPLNDWSRHESQFEIKGEFKGEAEIEGQRYVMPETSDEVRYAIQDVSLLVEDRLVDVVFKDHRFWRGPIYVLIYREGQRMPLRVVSVLPDNYYSDVYVGMPETTDLTKEKFFVVVTNVTLAENDDDEADTKEYIQLDGTRLMKRLKVE